MSPLKKLEKEVIPEFDFRCQIKNKDYNFYLYDILKDYVKTPPKELIRVKSNLELEHISSSSP